MSITRRQALRRAGVSGRDMNGADRETLRGTVHRERRCGS